MSYSLDDLQRLLSVVIPVAPDENSHHTLIAMLRSYAPELEIILAQEGGRAASLNAGIEASTKEFIWFLHSDSFVDRKVLLALQEAILQHPDALHYFSLSYGRYASLPMKITAAGANLRSLLFQAPYGDQGFCIARSALKNIGGYDITLPYGEDHAWMWQCKRQNIRLHKVNETIITSDRKYRIYGWWKVTILHQYMWIKQILLLWKNKILS